MKAFIKQNWRGIFARLPLPMLALAASYGVYQFALLFVPEWVAIIQASAFELAYISLAVVSNLSLAERKRANFISIGAVVVSVLYNSLAGYFHRQPSALLGTDIVRDITLAILHGAPLAIVAYLIADLLLHSEKKTVGSELPTEKANALDDLLKKINVRLDELSTELTVLKNAPAPDYTQNFADIGNKMGELINGLGNLGTEQERQNRELILLKCTAELSPIPSADSGEIVRPLGKPTPEQIREQRASGATWGELAVRYGYTERGLQKLAKGGGDEQSQ